MDGSTIAIAIALLAVTFWVIRRVSSRKDNDAQILASRNSPDAREVGRDVPWSTIVRQVFRVIEFERDGTVIQGGKVRTAKTLAPYGHLLVESPVTTDRVLRIPITHRDDFLLAASVFDEPRLADAVTQGELLVTYVPSAKLPGGLAGTAHALHYVLTPRGTLDLYYSSETADHLSQPEPEKLFGQFNWAGELRVGVNPEPSL